MDRVQKYLRSLNARNAQESTKNNVKLAATAMDPTICNGRGKEEKCLPVLNWKARIKIFIIWIRQNST